MSLSKLKLKTAVYCRIFNYLMLRNYSSYSTHRLPFFCLFSFFLLLSPYLFRTFSREEYIFCPVENASNILRDWFTIIFIIQVLLKGYVGFLITLMTAEAGQRSLRWAPVFYIMTFSMTDIQTAKVSLTHWCKHSPLESFQKRNWHNWLWILSAGKTLFFLDLCTY